MRLAWHVPRSTHTYFVDHLLSCNFTNGRTDILARFTQFVRGLRASPSMEVAVLCGVVAGDVQTTTGNNLHLVMEETGINPVNCSSSKVKEVLGVKLAVVPDHDSWRVAYLGKLLEARGEAHYEGTEVKELTVLIDSFCTN